MNQKYQEIEEKIAEVQKSKEEISSFIELQIAKEKEIEAEGNKEIEGIYEKIKALKEEKIKIEERNSECLKNLKFFKDFTNIEILDLFENQRGMVLKVKHESNYIQFKLIEEESHYEYSLLSTSMSIPSLPEIFKNEILFEKSQFRLFYIEMRDLLFSYE